MSLRENKYLEKKSSAFEVASLVFLCLYAVYMFGHDCHSIAVFICFLVILCVLGLV